MRISPPLPFFLLLLTCSFSPLPAQGIPALDPFPAVGDLYVLDSTGDKVWRLMDLNLDGDANDAGEVVVFYDDTLGTLPFTAPTGIAVGSDGTVYVSDSTEDRIFWFKDLDGDGTAHGVNEHGIWFDNTNASGVLLVSAQNLTVDGQGVIWVAHANTGSGGADSILRLQDTGGTLGANDPGEASVYFTVPNSVSVGDSIPTNVRVGPGGFIYYTEAGSTGVNPKGVYRLHDDVIPNGNCNDPGEVTPYFIPSVLGANPFHWGLAFDASGVMSLTDHGNDVIWQGTDLNGDLSIAAGTPEEVQWWTATAASLNWGIASDGQGGIYTAESQNPDRVLRMADTVIPNGNVNDPGEVTVWYDQTTAAAAIGNIRGLAFSRRPQLTVNPTPSIGTTELITVQADCGQLFGVWFSSGNASLPLPPFGVLELDLTPLAIWSPFYEGVLGQGGRDVTSVAVPGLPSIVGLTIYLQGYAGFVSRAQFTNGIAVTFQ
jgi:hypothetical protein